MRKLLLPGLVLLAACSSTPVAEVQAEKARDLRERGDQAAGRGDWKTAADYYGQSLEANPQSSETHLKRGNAYVEMYRAPGDSEGPSRQWLERAVFDYGRAVQLNPASYDGFFNRAMVACKFARFKDAVADLLQCVQIRPKEAEPHLVIGRLYEEKFEDRGIQALEHYDTYVELGGADEQVVRKVKEWRELKKALGAAKPPEETRAPTAEDEKAAEALHAQALDHVKSGRKAEAGRALEELLTKYAGTRYVKDREKQLQVLRNAFR